MTSVCMATYNGARFIKEQIDSILPQLAPDDELIVSDDGSTDGTLEILAEYAAKDTRVKLLRHEKSPAYARIRYSRNFYYATDNFENALRHAKGDYIFLSDQDDVWRSDKIRKMVENLKTVDFVMCSYYVVNEVNEVIEVIDCSYANFSQSLMRNLIRTPFLGCCMAFTKKVLEAVLPFPKRLITHDLWIGCIICKSYTFAVLDEKLVKHRRHSANTSNVGKRSKNPLLWKIFYRVKLFWFLKRFWR